MFDTINDCDRAQRQAPQQAYTWMIDSIEYIDSGVLVVDATEIFLKDIDIYQPKYGGRIKVLN